MKPHLAISRLQSLPAALAFAVGLSCLSLCGQTNTPKPIASGNRYLLVVETSRLMERRMPGLLQTVQDVFRKTLGNEMRAGDTIGTWTFNDTLNTGRIPLQRWSPGTQATTVGLLTNFLAREKYQKQARLEKVMPALGNVVENSPVLTVILIVSGATDISGTPYDDQINSEFKEWREQQQAKRMPFVVVFRSAQGRLTGFAVAAVPWPLEVPTLPQIPKLLAQTNAAPPAKKPATLPPLIVSGKKRQLSPVAPIAPASITNLDSASARLPAPTADPPTDPQPSTSLASSGAAPVQPSSLAPQPVPATKTESPAISDFPSSFGASVSASFAGAATSSPPAAPLVKEREAAQEAAASAATKADIGLASQSAETNVVPSTAPASPPISAPVPSVPPNTPDRLGLFPWMLAVAAMIAAIVSGLRWHNGRLRAQRPISLITQSLEHRN